MLKVESWSFLNETEKVNCITVEEYVSQYSFNKCILKSRNFLTLNEEVQSASPLIITSMEL